MGYHVELVATPARPILWPELATAARALGWDVDEGNQTLRFHHNAQLASTVVLTQGSAWTKSADEAALTALIALATQMGLRVRGEEGESYRSVGEWYVHPDDAEEHARAQAPSPYAALSLQRRRTKTIFLMFALPLALFMLALKLRDALQ